MEGSMITLSQFIVFFGYLAIIWKKFNVLESISQSSYEWEGQQAYYFMAMCWALGFLNLFQGMEEWGFITSAGLFFTGITVKWMEAKSVEFYLHSVGALVTVLVPFIGLYFMYGMFIPFGIFGMLAVATWYLLKNPIWWIEVQAFALILISYSLR